MRKYIVQTGEGRGGWMHRITYTITARNATDAKREARELARMHHRQWRGVTVERTH